MLKIVKNFLHYVMSNVQHFTTQKTFNNCQKFRPILWHGLLKTNVLITTIFLAHTCIENTIMDIWLCSCYLYC